MHRLYLESSSQLSFIKDRLHRQAQLPISNDVLHSHLDSTTYQRSCTSTHIVTDAEPSQSGNCIVAEASLPKSKLSFATEWHPHDYYPPPEEHHHHHCSAPPLPLIVTTDHHHCPSPLTDVLQCGCETTMKCGIQQEPRLLIHHNAALLGGQHADYSC